MVKTAFLALKIDFYCIFDRPHGLFRQKINWCSKIISMKTRSLYLLLIFCCLSWLTVHSQNMDDIAEQNDLVGMSVAVVCRGEVVELHHYGHADLGNDRLVGDSTLYRIASISKMVTATGMLQLYEQGLFDLDDPIGDYLGYEVVNPDFPEQPITFRMLLSHTSSLQDGDGYFDFLGATTDGGAIPALSDLILPGGNYYTSNLWRTEIPGTHFAYSNLNFGVIATLIEAISGQRFDLYMQEHILDPLGMTGSFNVNLLEDINQVAVLYRNATPQADNYNGTYPTPLDTTQYDIGQNGLVFGPQGSLRASALDLTKFLRMHANYGTYNGVQILDSATVALMHTPEWTYNGGNGDNYYNLFNEWGLGLQSTTNTANGDIVIGGVNMLGHPGEAYGLISDLYFERDYQFGLVFMTNGYYGSAGYSFGNNSAFYVPEESLFAFIKNTYWDNCLVATSAAEVLNGPAPFELDVHYDPAGHQLRFDGDLPEGRAYLYNTIGQSGLEFQLLSTEQKLPEHLGSGIYVLSLRTTAGVLTKKLLLVR